MIGLKLLKDCTMKYQEYKLFPTHVLRFDCSEIITQSEVYTMISDIDKICEDGRHIQNDEKTPKYQSKPILFLEDAPEIWQKLKYTFLDSCQHYLNLVDNFTNNQTALKFTGARAWFYKGWKSFNATQGNPWHNHNPSFLSGVFYLSVPSKGTEGGTEFMDPRANECHAPTAQLIEPMNLTWVIFPGWLYHKSNYCDTETPRYVIAADSYIRVN